MYWAFPIPLTLFCLWCHWYSWYFINFVSEHNHNILLGLGCTVHLDKESVWENVYLNSHYLCSQIFHIGNFHATKFSSSSVFFYNNFSLTRSNTRWKECKMKEVPCCVRGYLVYQAIWVSVVGKELAWESQCIGQICCGSLIIGHKTFESLLAVSKRQLCFVHKQR